MGSESTAPEPLVVQNPNPRFNENIREREDDSSSEDKNIPGTGSKITDGEEA